VVLNNGAQFSAVLQDEAADSLTNQFYCLCTGDIGDNLFEMSIKNESEKLENLLIPIRSILYVQCKEFIE
jgi:hypothetical protein